MKTKSLYRNDVLFLIFMVKEMPSNYIYDKKRILLDLDILGRVSKGSPENNMRLHENSLEFLIIYNKNGE